MDKLEIKNVSKSIEDDRFVLKVEIFNPLQRTAYSYAVVRRILYNSTTKELTLQLHDNHIDENSLISMHLKEPKMSEYEANASTILTLKLHSTLKRIKSHTELGSDRIELMEIHKAESIKIEIAQQDTPFYYNPKENNAAQLKKWGKEISVFSGKFVNKRDK